MEKNPYIIILSENKLFLNFTVTKLKKIFRCPYLKNFYGHTEYFFQDDFPFFKKGQK